MVDKSEGLTETSRVLYQKNSTLAASTGPWCHCELMMRCMDRFTDHTIGFEGG